MKLNDMTLADIDMAAGRHAANYEPLWRNAAKSSFIEGACWSYNHLTQEGNVPAWCDQNLSDQEDYWITPEILEKNRWKASPDKTKFLRAFEVNGIPVYFEYITTNKAFFYMDSIIPYPVEKLSQMQRIFEVLNIFMLWEK